jgi:hypothetical protein
MSAHYDVIVLGAGSSGYVAAIRAMQLGKNIQPGSADNGQPQTLSITPVQMPRHPMGMTPRTPRRLRLPGMQPHLLATPQEGPPMILLRARSPISDTL